MQRMRSFFTSLGWEEAAFFDEWSEFNTLGGRLALYPLERFGEEWDRPLPPFAPDGTFRGAAFAFKVESDELVAEGYRLVQNAGGVLLSSPHATDRGGYSFGFLDPEGNIWAITRGRHIFEDAQPSW